VQIIAHIHTHEADRKLSSDIQTLTGQPPTPLRRWLCDNISRFSHTQAKINPNVITLSPRAGSTPSILSRSPATRRGSYQSLERKLSPPLASQSMTKKLLLVDMGEKISANPPASYPDFFSFFIIYYYYCDFLTVPTNVFIAVPK
jgi:hypothetical protein